MMDGSRPKSPMTIRRSFFAGLTTACRNSTWCDDRLVDLRTTRGHGCLHLAMHSMGSLVGQVRVAWYGKTP